MTPPGLRPTSAVEMARRVAVGIGLAEVRELEQRVAVLGESVEENARLARALEAHVSRVEQSLVPVLERRARRERSTG